MLPESHTDFIFSIIAEEMGFVGAMLLVFLYLMLFFSCLWLGGNTREPYGRTIVLGMAALVITQTFINLAVALGLFPTTGITLPFVSSGGSSFISCCIMMGIVWSVANHHVTVLSKDDFKEY
jgi:cell division protein FtsW (lipid II flippase)